MWNCPTLYLSYYYVKLVRFSHQLPERMTITIPFCKSMFVGEFKMHTSNFKLHTNTLKMSKKQKNHTPTSLQLIVVMSNDIYDSESPNMNNPKPTLQTNINYKM